LGDRGVAPGVAAALAGRKTQVGARLLMQPLGRALGCLHCEAVYEEALAVLAFGFELLAERGRLVADGYCLQGDHVALPGVERSEEVGQADAVVLRLARRD